MFKSLSLAVLSLATLAACAQPMTNVMEERAAYRQQGLYNTAISAGACDDVGQFIREAQAPLSLRQEASAMPVHE
jgi:hypothetical protein